MSLYVRQRWRDARSQIRIAWLRLVSFVIGADRLELRFLYQQVKTTHSMYVEQLKASRRSGSNRQAEREVNDEAAFALGMLRERIDHIQTNMLLHEASRLGLPIHSEPSDWEVGTQSGKRSLTVAKTLEVRRQIRAEKSERRAVWEAWARIVGPAFTVATGFIGAVIGLISMLRK